MELRERISRTAGILLILALTLAISGCRVSASDEQTQQLPAHPETSATDETEAGPGYPEIHIIGVTLPEEYGNGYMDCEAAFWIVNYLRGIEGLEPLGRCDIIFQQASIERLDEITTDFSHTRPNGEKYSSVLREHNIQYLHSNENLACGQFTAEHVMHDWLASDTHKANLFDPDIDRVCIACRFDSSGIPYWVFEGIKYDPSYQMVVAAEYVSVSRSDLSVSGADALASEWEVSVSGYESGTDIDDQ